MRRVLGGALILLSFALVTGGGSEISGMLGSPSLLWAILLSLGAQVAVLAAASMASPKSGKFGFFRSVAFVFYLVQSVGLPVALFALVYNIFKRVQLLGDSELIWALSTSLTAAVLLIFLVRAWRLTGPPREGQVAASRPL